MRVRPHPSGRKIGLGDLDSVGVKRPVAKRLRFAEFSLCPFGGIDFVRSVNFQRTLTNFRLPAVFAEYILQEANDKSRHETLLLRHQHQNRVHIIRGCGDRFDRDQNRVELRRRNLGRPKSVNASKVGFKPGASSDYWSLISAALITLPHRSTSSCMYFVALSAEPPNVSADSFLRRSCNSGWRSASFTSALILSVMFFGVFGGAVIANQATASKPGSVSAIVGISGRDGRRWLDATASSLRLPASTSGRETPRLSNIRSTSPASRPASAGADPRYGMVRSFTLAITWKSSAARCEVVPMPCVAAVTFSGFFCR